MSKNNCSEHLLDLSIYPGEQLAKLYDREDAQYFSCYFINILCALLKNLMWNALKLWLISLSL